MTALLIVLHLLVDVIFDPSPAAYMVFLIVVSACCGVISLAESRRARRGERVDQTRLR